jgi:DNA-binding NtrC family response regulator
MKRIIVLEPPPPHVRRIVSVLESEGFQTVPVQDVMTLDQHAGEVAVTVCDAGRVRDARLVCGVPVLAVADQPSLKAAVAAIKAGASDYLPGDVPTPELLNSVSRALAEHSAAPLTDAFPMVGMSPPMAKLFDNIAKVAPTDSTVLICGESGTGKELVARAIHAASRRRYAPLISLNCATLPADLIETELFGRPGDGASGLLRAAEGGTLFLDEIGELPPSAQSQLLKTLSDAPDLRLITATQRDLEPLVEKGQFRSDLYYRLKVVALYVPPLRERGDDIQLLADAILDRTQAKLGKSGLAFADETREDMRRYPWPGNVRELENAIQRAAILSDGGPIDTAGLAIELPRESSAEPGPTAAPDQTIEDYFVSFVTAHQDHMTETELAEKLGISRKSLWERRQRLNIPRKKTKKRGRRRDVS